MSALSLSKKKDSVMPVELDGCRINPSFKNILRILRLLQDNRFPEKAKCLKAVEYFFLR
jgi:hypothetical protein